jgi:phosphoribosylformylglycinamidine synthase
VVSLLGDPFVGLFSESAARAVVTVQSEKLDPFLAMAASLGVSAGEIGRTGGSALVVADRFQISLDELSDAWRGTLPAVFGH